MIDATGLVKVLDFGVARSDFSGRESQTRELQFGSVEYMAPERLFFEPETPALLQYHSHFFLRAERVACDGCRSAPN